MKVHDLGWWLVVLAALNLGLTAVGQLMGGDANWNVVETVFRAMPGAVNVVYLLVGVSGLWLAWQKLSK